MGSVLNRVRLVSFGMIHNVQHAMKIVRHA